MKILEKFCAKCKTRKSVTLFYKNKAKEDGFQTQCKICMKKTNSKSYKKHKTQRDIKNMQYNRSEKGKQYRRKWAYNKYHSDEQHRKKIIQRAVAYERLKLKNDTEFKIKHTLRNRLRKAVKSQSAFKHDKTMTLVGCSVSFLRNYLQQKFKEGMTWENHGQWHIDHIKPCASFNLNNESEQKECFHYSNLQPLWASENIIKGSRIIGRLGQ